MGVHSLARLLARPDPCRRIRGPRDVHRGIRSGPVDHRRARDKFRPPDTQTASSTIDCVDPGGLVGICRICLASPRGRIVGLGSPQASGSRGALCRRLPWTPVRFVDESGLVCHRWLGRVRNLGCGLVVYLQMRPAPLSQPAALPPPGNLRAAGLYPHSNWPRQRRPSVGADEPLCLRADVVLDGARRRPADRRSGRLAATEVSVPGRQYSQPSSLLRLCQELVMSAPTFTGIERPTRGVGICKWPSRCRPQRLRLREKCFDFSILRTRDALKG